MIAFDCSVDCAERWGEGRGERGGGGRKWNLENLTYGDPALFPSASCCHKKEGKGGRKKKGRGEKRGRKKGNKE